MPKKTQDPRTHGFDQAVKPAGLLGHLMGFLMGRMNDAQNKVTVNALPVSDNATVLEIGFGPGRALAQLARQTMAARIDGIDHSSLMVETARRRNQRAVSALRMNLTTGDVAALPACDNTYDVCFAVNNFQQWPDQAGAIREVHRVLKPDGRLCLSVRVPKRDTGIETVEHTLGTVSQAVSLLEQQSFEEIEKQEHDLGNRYAILIFGTKV